MHENQLAENLMYYRKKKGLSQEKLRNIWRSAVKP